MTEFQGFPSKMQFTPIPNIVFSSLLPQITDINELKVLLHFFAILYTRKGNLRFVTENEILSRFGLNDNRDSSLEKLKPAIDGLVQKGAILKLSLDKGEATETIYFLNTQANKANIEGIRSGAVVLPDIKPVKAIPEVVPPAPDIFTLYEQNIGMLTPLIADELREAGKNYPESWIKDAIKEAVSQNKRNWRYIARILEHWSTEGRDDGALRGNSKKNADPDKYIRGKYGHMVQR